MNRFALVGMLLLGACDCGSSHTVDASMFVDARTGGACGNGERPRMFVGARTEGCALDEDCTEGDQGRCVRLHDTTFHCTYDECDSDADCPEGDRCGCAVGQLAQDQCLRDRCEGECAPDDCAPTFQCGGPGGISPAHSAQFFVCHTPDDECLTSADCPAEEFCTRSATTGGPELPHWECRAVTCH